MTEAFLDQFGRLIERRVEGSPDVRTVYEEDKSTAVVVDPDTVPGNGNERTTRMAYDSAGRLISVTDPLTRVTALTDFDEADRPETIILPDTSETSV